MVSQLPNVVPTGKSLDVPLAVLWTHLVIRPVKPRFIIDQKDSMPLMFACPLACSPMECRTIKSGRRDRGGSMPGCHLRVVRPALLDVLTGERLQGSTRSVGHHLGGDST